MMRFLFRALTRTFWPFCPNCGANYVIPEPSFFLVLPYYLHLLKCAKPAGIIVKFGVWYDVNRLRNKEVTTE